MNEMLKLVIFFTTVG